MILFHNLLSLLVKISQILYFFKQYPDLKTLAKSFFLQFLFTSYSLQIYCLFGTTSDTVIPSTEHHVKLNHSQKHSFRDCKLHDHSLPPGSLELLLPTFSHVAMEGTSPGCSNFRHCYAWVKSLSSGQLLLGKKPIVLSS